MNSICITGRLTAEPTHRPANTETGTTARTEFRVAVSGPRTERDLNRTYIAVITYGPTATAVADHLAKGSHVAVDGRLEQREWDDTDGNHHCIYRIIANRIDFLGPRPHTP